MATELFPKISMADPVAAPPAKSFPWGVIIALLLAGLVGAGIFVFREKIFHRSQSSEVKVSDETNVAVVPKAPPIVLPATSDTNWIMNLEEVTTPDAPAVGRIHGQCSTLDRAIFQGGVLTFRPSVKGSPEVSLSVNFAGAAPEALAGKTINVMTNAEQAAGVILRWKENGQNAKIGFDNSYALRLEMGALAGNRVPGKIYFCAPDEAKSYVLGTFNMEIRKPKPPKPKK